MGHLVMVTALALAAGAKMTDTAPSEQLERAVLRVAAGSTEARAGDWTIHAGAKGRIVATREIQHVGGRAVEDYDDEAVRLAVRAAVVNHLLTQASGILVRVDDGTAFLDGTVADRASVARAVAAAAWVPYLERIESRLRD